MMEKGMHWQSTFFLVSGVSSFVVYVHPMPFVIIWIPDPMQGHVVHATLLVFPVGANDVLST